MIEVVQMYLAALLITSTGMTAIAALLGDEETEVSMIFIALAAGLALGGMLLCGI